MAHRSSLTPRDLECMLCDEMAEPKALPLSLLEEITNGFSDQNQIGRGGFAVVYKGKLENRTVAVKKMLNSYKYEKEFQREVECLIIAKHKNVVRFLRYCADTQGNLARHNGKFIMADVQQRLLCFEYVSKGSLHDYIADTSRGLQWRDRFQIIMGICQGLHYLHQKHIVHLDLKPGNILLDENWVPKITDFGISRCYHEMQSQVISKIAGTPGYLAPEYFDHTEVTYRNSYRLDIYSLGVVIIEILTGKKGHHDVDKVVESWTNMLEKSQSGVQQKQVRVCAQIGIECTNFNPAKRPDVQHIISRLGDTESIDGYIEACRISSKQINLYMLNDTMRGFWVSYQELNPDIRRCIEFCSIFPKGSKLRRDKLCCLWIAQGFVITSSATSDIEEIAKGYFQELVSYSFMKPEETSDGEGCFTIHDVMHDLLDKVVGNCFRIENAMNKRGKVWERDVPRDVQHLLIHNYDAELITEKILGLQNLLTLIVYVVDTPVEERVIVSICKRLPDLRVLAFAFSQEHAPIQLYNTFSVPKSISELKHLCYLAFRKMEHCKVILPSTINKLQHIQVLDFGDGSIVEFNFGDLINLRRIICGLGEELANIGGLIALQTLRNFKVWKKEGYELKQLRDLNKLRGCLEIGGLENVRTKYEALKANLAAKERLTELILKWSFSGAGKRRGSRRVQEEVLKSLCPAMWLKKLEIYRYEGSRYPDWMVGKRNGGLEELALWHWTQLGPAPQLVDAFPHLCVLRFCDCSWDTLPGNMEHLTSLKELVISRCFNIRLLPTLPMSLEDLLIEDCDDEFVLSCRHIGAPNWKKIHHVIIKELHLQCGQRV